MKKYPLRIKYIPGLCILLCILLCLLLSPFTGIMAKASRSDAGTISQEELDKLDKQLETLQKEAAANASAAEEELAALEQEIQSAKRLYTIILVVCAFGIVTVLTVALHLWKKNGIRED